MPLLPASLQHTFPFCPPQPTSPGLSPVNIQLSLMVAYGIYTSAFSTPTQRKTQSLLLHPQDAGAPSSVLPGVKQAPSSPDGRRLPFLALQNVGVRAKAPHNTTTPAPQNTPPWSIRCRTRLAAIPGVHRRLPGSLAPHPPQAGSGRPLPRGRLRGAHSYVPGSRAHRRPRGPARAALWLLGRSGRPRPIPRAPHPRPPRYLPAEPHDPVQLGFILKQVPELPGAEDPKAPRAAGLRPRPRRPGPVHAARPRPQLGCWLGPFGPLRPGSAPLRSGSGIRLRLRP